MELIIDVPEEIYESQRYAQYFGAWSVVLQKHFENGTPIPDNATNGDIIKAMFPNVNDRDFNLRYVSVHDLDNDGGLMIEKEWWNAPYQNGGNVE